VTEIAAGRVHSLALKNDGTVWSWGSNGSGQLGNGTLINSTVPIQVTGVSNITLIAAGEQHTLTRDTDASAWTWGSNSNGELGIGTNTNSKVPVQVTVLCPLLSVNDIPAPSLVSVYPNPSTGKFTVNLPGCKGILEIYNILGKQVYRSEFNGQGSVIDLSNQPNGIYLAKFYSGEKIHTVKLVIR
jgi:hypothetical protein